MYHQPHNLDIELPAWIEDFAQSYTNTPDIHQRMAFVISAAERSVRHSGGGPFAAAVFERDSARLVSLGVNLVMTQGLSILHAELVAISIAQRKLNTYDLGGQGIPAHELLSSAEPCAMCFGAIPWSGITRVVTAARGEDSRSIGFDEGAMPADWKHALQDRGIEIISDVNRYEACAVLQLYKTTNGHLYNSREA